MESLKETFKIAKVLASLFTRSSTPGEEKDYHDWIAESEENERIAKQVLNPENYEENKLLLSEFPSREAWGKISPLLGNNYSTNSFSKKGWLYAAIIILLLIPASYLIYNNIASEEIKEISPGKRGANLILADGNTLDISPETYNKLEYSMQVFIINKEGINYQTPKNKPQIKASTNTLLTQQGMECNITLSDGTKIHLNAQSRLTYPICFSGENRVVHVEGEAYFDVAHDSERPFIVKTPHTSIEVTGTSFNVRAYNDESIESTTLVSGGIKIACGKKEVELTPNQHFVYNKASRQTSLEDVNTELYTSWKSGAFIFMNIPLDNIMSYLSKWYRFNYTFDDEFAKDIRIGAYLNRYESMNPIIDMIKSLNLVDIKQQDKMLHISKKQKQ